jgi:hypothetical protein
VNWPKYFCAVGLLFVIATGFGQSPCAPKCEPIKWAPISGRVTDATDGHPLADALVSYSGRGDVLQRLGGEAINPPSIQGSVRTASDGAYTLPMLSPGGFEVRVSAPGYFSAKQILGEQPVGYHAQPLALPASVCMATKGRPDCTAPPLPDGMFKLQPDAIELRPMSSDARTKFALPGNNPRSHWINTMAFSQDGTHAAFITQDSFAAGGEQSCLGWNYDLSSGQLVRTPEALPSEYCVAVVRIVWDGPAIYAFDPWIYSRYPNSDNVEVMRWDGAGAASVRVGDLPSDFQQALASKVKTIIRNAAGEAEDALAQTTADGQFHLSSGDGDGRQCFSLTIASTQGDWKKLENTCTFPRSYLLDRDHDLFALFESPTLAKQNESFEKLTLFNLKAHSQRSFPTPNTHSRPQLLAEQPLADGTTRIAYSVEGDCDPASPDAVHNPPAGQPITEVKPLNVCFVRIPSE